MNWKMIGALSLIGSTAFFAIKTNDEYEAERPLIPDVICYTTEGCVFRTIFGEEKSLPHRHQDNLLRVRPSIERGLEWIIKAQQPNGGWGAGSHYRQDVMDPHAVPTDPATTAMVAMSLLRTGSRLDNGPHSTSLSRALEYMLKEVENTPDSRPTITDQTGTQIQTKLGSNIDAVLALQFLTNMMEYTPEESENHSRIVKAMNVCASKIQSQQTTSGNISGSGWAGVLQSALANNALEAAEYYGADVDEDALDRSREYQKSNYDPTTGNVDTSTGAGIVLYSVSGSVRASAKQARKVREEVREARRQGKIDEEGEVSEEMLMDLGYSNDEAIKLTASYKVYESSKKVAQSDNVISGFGNNGGEEFLSFLQTGESLIINDDDSWEKWFDETSSRLMDIQNQDGSWNGHHCITSPVFCTATTLLILSINEDRERLIEMGSDD